MVRGDRLRRARFTVRIRLGGFISAIADSPLIHPRERVAAHAKRDDGAAVRCGALHGRTAGLACSQAINARLQSPRRVHLLRRRQQAFSEQNVSPSPYSEAPTAPGPRVCVRETAQLAGLQRCGIRWPRDSQPQPAISERERELEPTRRFELRTCCLRNSCSTAELCRRRTIIGAALRQQLFAPIARTIRATLKPLAQRLNS